VTTRYSGLIAVDDRPADGGLGLTGGDKQVLPQSRDRALPSCFRGSDPEPRGGVVDGKLEGC